MSSIRKSVSKLFLATVGMFLFGFALVPIYDVFCEITGLNGKVTGPTFSEYEDIGNREIKITFTTTNNNGMPWFFDSDSSQMRVKTGEQNLMSYVFTNTTDKPMIAQAIPSVSPGKGAQYFHKTECFCFEQQYLEPGESISIPLKFVIDPDLPKDISSLALGYTLFDITKDQMSKQASNEYEFRFFLLRTRK